MDFDLEDALARYPLPSDIEDLKVNRGQCALSLGVSEPMISRYLDQGMPVVSRGSNGQAYEFQLSECYAWKMHRDEESRARRDAGDKAAAQMALLFRNDDEEDDAGSVMSADQIIKESQADYQKNRAAELRRELVRAHRVTQLFEDVLTEVRTQFVTLVDFAEMEFSLSPEQVRRLQVRCDGTLTQMRQVFSEAVPGEVQNLKPHMGLSDDTERAGEA